jgi:uncharacterized membrane protein YjfL (UPF0719 family)
VDVEDLNAMHELQAEATRGPIDHINRFLRVPKRYLAQAAKRQALDNTAAGSTAVPMTNLGGGNAPLPEDSLGDLTHAASIMFVRNIAADEVVSLPRAVAYSGYVVSVGVLLRSSFMITNGSKQPDADVITYSLYWLAIGAILQHVGYYGQRLLLWGRNAPSSESNLAAGIIDMSMYISMALQVGSNLLRNGENGSFDIPTETVDSIIYFLIQMALLALAGWAYRLVTKFDDVSAIRSGNVAVAVCNGMTTVAFAVLAQQPTTRTQEIVSLIVFFVVGVIVLQINRATLINKLIMVSQDLDKEIIEDRNWGAALTEGTITILLAQCYCTFLREICAPVAGADTPFILNVTSTLSP